MTVRLAVHKSTEGEPGCHDTEGDLIGYCDVATFVQNGVPTLLNTDLTKVVPTPDIRLLLRDFAPMTPVTSFTGFAGGASEMMEEWKVQKQIIAELVRRLGGGVVIQPHELLSGTVSTLISEVQRDPYMFILKVRE